MNETTLNDQKMFFFIAMIQVVYKTICDPPLPPPGSCTYILKPLKAFFAQDVATDEKRRNFLEHCFKNKHIFEAIKDALYFCYLNKIKRCLVSFWKKLKYLFLTILF